MLKTLNKNLNGISAHEALELLVREFNRSGAMVIFPNERRATVSKLLGEDTKLKYWETIAAENFGPIVFWGGPPEDRRWFGGTLLTLLADTILYQNSITGEYADLIHDETFAQTV
jgi:hypothetical protein